MLPKQTSVLSLLISAVIAGILISSGYEAHQEMRAKAQAQQQAVSDFQTWKSEYTTLLPVDEKWNTSLHSITEARDLLSVYQLIGTQPMTNPDLLLVEKIEPLNFQDKPLGAMRACLSSASGNGVVFEAPKFAELTAGLDALAQRPDIQMGSIRYTQDKGKARAVVSGFCLVLRNHEGGRQ